MQTGETGSMQHQKMILQRYADKPHYGDMEAKKALVQQQIVLSPFFHSVHNRAHRFSQIA